MPEGTQSSEFQRRMPAVDRQVSEIKPEDIRVKVTGTIVDVQGTRAVLDDGTGKLEMSLGELKAEPQKLVRVFGRVMAQEGGLELQAEILQDMSGLDLELMRKIREAEKQIKS